MAGGRGVPEPFLFSLTRSVFHSPPRLPAAQRRFCALEPYLKGPQGLPSLPSVGRCLGEEPWEDAPQRARLPWAYPTPTAGYPAQLRDKEGRSRLGAARVSQGRGVAGVSGESIS